MINPFSHVADKAATRVVSIIGCVACLPACVNGEDAVALQGPVQITSWYALTTTVAVILNNRRHSPLAFNTVMILGHEIPACKTCCWSKTIIAHTVDDN